MDEKQFSVKTSSARRSSVSELDSLTVRESQKKMFENQKIFAIKDDGVKSCNVHSDNKLVFPKEIEIANNLKCVLTVFNV